MNGGSRYMCGREPAGQLPTSSTISERAASTHGSSKVAVGRGRTQARHVGGCGPDGGHSSDQTRGRWSKLSQKAHRRSHVVRPQLGPSWQRLGIGHVGRIDVLVLEPLHLADRPHHCVEHRASLLADGDTLREHGASRPQRGDHQIDRCERRNRKVVTEEAGRTGEVARRPRGAQGERGHVPTAGSPDLPVGVHHRGEAAVPHGLDGGLPLDVTHDHASQRVRVSSVTTISSPRFPVVVRQYVKPRCSMTRPEAMFSGS